MPSRIVQTHSLLSWNPLNTDNHTYLPLISCFLLILLIKLNNMNSRKSYNTTRIIEFRLVSKFLANDIWPKHNPDSTAPQPLGIVASFRCCFNPHPIFSLNIPTLLVLLCLKEVPFLTSEAVLRHGAKFSDIGR